MGTVMLRNSFNSQLLYCNHQFLLHNKYQLIDVHIGYQDLDWLYHPHIAHQFRQRDPSIDIVHELGHYLMAPYIELLVIYLHRIQIIIIIIK